MKTNTILVGPVGTGKTRTILTLLSSYRDEKGQTQRGAGLETFFLTMEPNWAATIRDHGCADGLHVHYLSAAPPSWDTTRRMVELLTTNTMKNVIEMADPNKRQYTHFSQVFGICMDFRCQKCGQSFGDVSEWGEDRALFGDGLSPLSKMAMEAVAGGKPVQSKPEYYAAQGFLLGLLRLLFQATKCSVILTAHAAREVDPVTGTSMIVIDTIGQRLTPEIIKLPDEIILTERERGRFTWNTMLEAGTQLKRNRLPERSGLAPDFAQIFREGTTS